MYLCVYIYKIKSNGTFLFSAGNPGAGKPRWSLHDSTWGWSVPVYHRYTTSSRLMARARWRICKETITGLQWYLLATIRLNGISAVLVPANKEKCAIWKTVVEVDPFLSVSLLSDWFTSAPTTYSTYQLNYMNILLCDVYPYILKTGLTWFGNQFLSFNISYCVFDGQES